MVAYGVLRMRAVRTFSLDWGMHDQGQPLVFVRVPFGIKGTPFAYAARRRHRVMGQIISVAIRTHTQVLRHP